MVDWALRFFPRSEKMYAVLVVLGVAGTPVPLVDIRAVVDLDIYLVDAVVSVVVSFSDNSLPHDLVGCKSNRLYFLQ